MKTVKVHGLAKEWLESYVMEEEQEIRSGGFGLLPYSMGDMIDMDVSKRKRKKEAKKNELQ